MFGSLTLFFCRSSHRLVRRSNRDLWCQWLPRRLLVGQAFLPDSRFRFHAHFCARSQVIRIHDGCIIRLSKKQLTFVLSLALVSSLTRDNHYTLLAAVHILGYQAFLSSGWLVKVLCRIHWTNSNTAFAGRERYVCKEA